MEMRGDQARRLSPGETEAPALDGPVGEGTDLTPKGTRTRAGRGCLQVASELNRGQLAKSLTGSTGHAKLSHPVPSANVQALSWPRKGTQTCLRWRKSVKK